jgi:hypothetical protein
MSRVDHILCSDVLLPYLHKSEVIDGIDTSDHFPLQVIFLHQYTGHNLIVQHLQPKPIRLKWKGAAERTYSTAVQEAIGAGDFQRFVDALSVADVNCAVDLLLHQVFECATASGLHKDTSARVGARYQSVLQHATHKQAWFDHECWLARRIWRRYQATNHPDRREFRSQYKSLLRAKRRAWQKQAIKECIDEAH